MDFSLQLLPEQPLAELIEVIRVADALGFRACYSADETYHKDMWILFAAAAPTTHRLRFGPEVTHVILRDPTLIAQQAATLDELDGSFDFCASVLGAISDDSGAAKEAARVAAAFYISSMAPELVERHGIAYEQVRPVVDAFRRGEVERALALTTSVVGERLSVAGAPAEWVERLRADFVPHGYNHIALGLVDPYLVESWSGRRVSGLPDLASQLELFAGQVVPALAGP